MHARKGASNCVSGGGGDSDGDCDCDGDGDGDGEGVLQVGVSQRSPCNSRLVIGLQAWRRPLPWAAVRAARSLY
jgi:hypothetical protein